MQALVHIATAFSEGVEDDARELSTDFREQVKASYTSSLRPHTLVVKLANSAPTSASKYSLN